MVSLQELDEIAAIFDAVLQNTAQLVAHTELHAAEPPEDMPDVVSVYLSTVGEVEAHLHLQLDHSLMQALTSAMSRGRALSTEDTIDYIKEFFNIFCGHLAAALRRYTKKRAHFGIANFLAGPMPAVQLEGANVLQRSYAAKEGALRLRAVWR